MKNILIALAFVLGCLAVIACFGSIEFKTRHHNDETEWRVGGQLIERTGHFQLNAPDLSMNGALSQQPYTGATP